MKILQNIDQEMPLILQKDPPSSSTEKTESPKLLTLDTIMVESKQLVDFPVISNRTLGKLC